MTTATPADKLNAITQIQTDPVLPDLPPAAGYRYSLDDPCYTEDQMQAYATAHASALLSRAELAEQTITMLRAALNEIGDYAHDKSTGPTVPDALWDVRQMAYEASDIDAAALAKGQQTEGVQK